MANVSAFVAHKTAVCQLNYKKVHCLQHAAVVELSVTRVAPMPVELV